MNLRTNLNSDIFWKNRKVLVTGSSGFIGSWLVKKLNKLNAEVFEFDIIARKDQDLINFEVLENIIKQSQCEIIFHLGAQAIVDEAIKWPLSTFEVNIRGTYHLLEAARKNKSGIKTMVIASSDKAYGNSELLPYSETMPLNGIAPYEVSKSCADMLATSYAKTYELPVVISRCGNVYGGGDIHWSRLIPGTIRSALMNTCPEIRSNGEYVRDFIFIDDIIDGYLKLASTSIEKNLIGEAFNFSTGIGSSVNEVVDLILKILDREELKPLTLNRAENEIFKQVLDTTKAQKILDWTPQCSLEEGLKETIPWYVEYFGNLK